MDARILLELLERTSTERPIDTAGSLEQLDAPAGFNLPDAVEGVTGQARAFDPGADQVLAAVDATAGATLLTRDVTVQAIITWDFASQDAEGEPGTLIARGKGTGAAEYMCFGLELRVVNSTELVGELRWLWHDIAGVLKTQIGAHFQAGFDAIMLTATRRWVSPTEVELAYYYCDELIGTVISADGSIGGGTTGTTSIGRRFTGATYERPFAGAIDQLRVLPRAMCAEEIRATWERITVHQPRTRQLVRELHPPDFPMSVSPGSRMQRENAVWGDALGFPVAQVENLRNNIYPQRAYGADLEEWEIAMRRPAGPRDAIELRRNRVTARLAQRLGVSIPGIEAALKLFVATDVDNLEVMAFDQTVREDWAAGLRVERWMSLLPAGGTAVIASGALELKLTAGGSALEAPVAPWLSVLTSIGGHGRGVHVIAKVTPTLVANGQLGVMLGDRVNHNYVTLVLEGASPTLRAEVWRAGIRTATPVGVALGTGAAPIWLHLRQVGPTIAGVDPGTADGDFIVGRSTAGPLGPFTYSAAFQAPIKMQWAGLVNKRIGTTAGDVTGLFDDVMIRTPNADRAYHLYVYRNPALPGRPDIVGANGAIREIAHAWTHARVITKKSVICDDPASPCDGGPCGGF